MAVLIERDAFQTILYGALSCRCPLTEATEVSLFQSLFDWTESDARPFAPIRAIADRNPSRTPIHNLFEVASYRYDDPEKITITFGDALRALGSKFHFNNLVQGLNPLTVRDVPAFLVSHMLVPVRLSGKDEARRIAFASSAGEIVFHPVFFPPGILQEENGLYGLHMGTVICRLTASQAGGLARHLDLIPDFGTLCRHVSRVDFHDFQYFGDYCDQVRQRFRRHFECRCRCKGDEN